MTNRDRAIRQAFEEGFATGHWASGEVLQGLEVERMAAQAFESWARNHVDLVDHVPGIHSRLNELEAKLNRIEVEKQEMRDRQ